MSPNMPRAFFNQLPEEHLSKKETVCPSMLCVWGPVGTMAEEAGGKCGPGHLVGLSTAILFTLTLMTTEC